MRKNPKAAIQQFFVNSEDQECRLGNGEEIKFNGFKAVRRPSVATFRYRGEFGRQNVQIICSFCRAQQTGYVWSMAGGGKRCYNCKAYLHAGAGYDYAIVETHIV